MKLFVKMGLKGKGRRKIPESTKDKWFK